MQLSAQALSSFPAPRQPRPSVRKCTGGGELATDSADMLLSYPTSWEGLL